MSIVAHSEVKNRFLTSVVIFLLKWSNNYFIANLQTTALIISLVFLVIANINFMKGDVSFLFTPEFEQFAKLLGVNKLNIMGPQVFLSIILRISFVVLILNTLAKWLVSQIFHKNINLTRVALLQGVIVITVLGLLAGVSCFTPNAMEGAETIFSFVLFLWVLALGSFSGSIIWGYLSDKFFSILERSFGL